MHKANQQRRKMQKVVYLEDSSANINPNNTHNKSYNYDLDLDKFKLPLKQNNIQNKRYSFNNKLGVKNNKKSLNNVFGQLKYLTDQISEIKELIKENDNNLIKYDKIIQENLSNIIKNNNNIKEFINKKKEFSNTLSKNNGSNINYNNIENDEEDKKLFITNKGIDNLPAKNSPTYLSKKRKLIYSDNKYDNSKNNSDDDFNLFSDNNTNSNSDEDNIEKDVSKEEKLYDVLDYDKVLFSIRGNVIENLYADGQKHHYVFFNKKYDVRSNIGWDKNNNYSFTIKLLNKCDFFGVGFCDKNALRNYGFEYDITSTGKKIKLGLYALFTNKLIWNSFNSKECYLLKYNNLAKKDTVIKCTLNPDLGTIEFIINNEFFVDLTKVRTFFSLFYSPVLIFLKKVAVETIFDY